MLTMVYDACEKNSGQPVQWDFPQLHRTAQKQALGPTNTVPNIMP